MSITTHIALFQVQEMSISPNVPNIRSFPLHSRRYPPNIQSLHYTPVFFPIRSRSPHTKYSKIHLSFPKHSTPIYSRFSPSFPNHSRTTPEPTLHILTINAYKIPDSPPAWAHTYTMHLRVTYLTPTIYIRHTYYTHTIYQPNPIPYTYPTRPIYIHTTTWENWV